MTRLQALGRQFDLIVLDPPKFARVRHAIPEALRGYRHLQSLALKMLPADGILVMCCCSGLITFDMIEELLAQLAADERRELRPGPPGAERRSSGVGFLPRIGVFEMLDYSRDVSETAAREAGY